MMGISPTKTEEKLFACYDILIDNLWENNMFGFAETF